MNETLNDLTQVLSLEADVHAELFKAAEAKRIAIIQGDLDAMETILGREEELLAGVEKLEHERIALVEVARQGLGLNPASLKLGAIIEAARSQGGTRAEEADALEAIHGRLKEILTGLRQRTRQNAELMKASMEHVDAFLRTIAHTCAPKRGYGSDGRMQSTATGLINRRA